MLFKLAQYFWTDVERCHLLGTSSCLSARTLSGSSALAFLACHRCPRDPAKEPIAASYSAPGVLAEAAHKTGTVKADFELREISKEEYDRIKSLIL